MAINTQITGRSADIYVSGRFDFDVQREFTDACTQLLGNPAVHEIKIEMSDVDYIGDSAPGFLLLLHYRALAANKKIVLSNISSVASHKLKATNFDGLFDLRQTALFKIENSNWKFTFRSSTSFLCCQQPH